MRAIRTLAFGIAVFFATAAPHFTTLDGRIFDFQGIGVYTGVLIDSPPFETQLYMSRRQGTTVSFMHGMAFRAPSQDTITFVEAEPSYEVFHSTAGPITASGSFPGVNVSRNGDSWSLQFPVPSIQVDVEAVPTGPDSRYEFVPVFLPLSSLFGLPRGLYGNFNGDPLDDNLDPQGVPILDVTAFGHSWRVPAGGSFFPTPDVADTNDCTEGCNGDAGCEADCTAIMTTSECRGQCEDRGAEALDLDDCAAALCEEGLGGAEPFLECSPVCHEHGTCAGEGECICHEGFSGPACQQGGGAIPTLPEWALLILIASILVTARRRTS